MEKFRIGLLVGIELVDDIDGLGRHAEAPHEVMVGRYLLNLHPRTGDQIVELHAEQDLAIITQLRGELRRHGPQILLLLESLAEELAEFGVDRLGIVIAQEAEARIDFLLKHFPIDPGESGKDLDQRGKKVGALRDGLWTPLQATPAFGHRALQSGSSPQDAIDQDHSPARRLGTILPVRIRIRSGRFCCS